MTFSPLATETHNTSQKSARSQPINMVVLHHAATTNEQWVIDVETSGTKQVSSHLVVKDNRRAGIVPEEFRAWSLSDAYWDSRAMTVECANESTNGWTISDASHESLARLVADWALRYNFYPHRNGDPKTWTVIGHREVYTIHGGSYGTACPGGMNLDWITNRAQQLLAGGFAGNGVTLLMSISSEKYVGENGPKPDGANIFNFVDWTLSTAKKILALVARQDVRREQINDRQEAIHLAQNIELKAIRDALAAGKQVSLALSEADTQVLAGKIADAVIAKTGVAPSPADIAAELAKRIAD